MVGLELSYIHFEMRFSFCSYLGRVNWEAQYYEIKLKNSFFGVEKFNFFLGLLLILYCIFLIKSSVKSLKSLPLGI